MKTSDQLLSFVFTALAASIFGSIGPATAADKPILVELFTSEGCSSCPSADRFLSDLRKSNNNIILIGEHVDYWNGLGWADPFSSAQWTERQRKYCQKLGANSCYTPQAVINGQRECVGSNQSAVREAISATSDALTVAIDLKVLKQAAKSVDISVTVGNSPRAKNVELFLVEDGVIVNVPRGENGGRQLGHDGVVRAHAMIENVKSGTVSSASLPLNTDGHPERLRVVALVEDQKGPYGAAQQALSRQ
jgi:hypothetical protein